MRFQSTLPRRERRSRDYVDSSKLTISIHAPAKGATHAAVFLEFLHTNFNPRSREGSDGSRDYVDSSKLTISIHAPAKGATNLSASPEGAENISIHAPAKGATTLSFASIFILSNFNPRSREGSDLSMGIMSSSRLQFQSTLPRRERPVSFEVVAWKPLISIHAPAKGATATYVYFVSWNTDFNPRSREGSDKKSSISLKLIQLFQSTLPRRERHQKSHISFQILIFI